MSFQSECENALYDLIAYNITLHKQNQTNIIFNGRVTFHRLL